ncbi:GNAT family N-acetyltransferase [Streptomyces sp. LP05-1]|uniref:GNAT family N-acetyltransferase n=1 Tax=Streptomyces pyxinae TaxID=2970734 RepID=A0ABT2CKG1_9ACTN|nr:GNAT family N-acetyltransferase [Streptomyces sp. LP05-1]MCS0637800.1 GNAT family N-acetyltransferase [Streptomyces sp. LP05-1]
MTRGDTVTVGGLDGRAAEQAEEAFRLVYAEVFAESPYNEDEEDVAAAFRRFRSGTRKAGFRAALARDTGDEPVGIAYGHPLSADTRWWGRLTEPVPDDIRREDGRRTLGLLELAVRERWRGQGVARRLHETLLDGIEAERVLLNVHPDSTAASAAYRSWGYRKVGEARPWAGADPHDVLLLVLR